MPKRSGSERVEAYTTKKEISMPEAYKSRVARANVTVFSVLADLEAKCAGILTAHNITGNNRVTYLNFVRKMWSQIRNGTLTEDKKRAIMAYYEALDCDVTVLNELSNAITGVV